MRVLVCLLALLGSGPAWGQSRGRIDADAQAALDELKAEPGIAEVQRAALELRHVDADSLDSMRTRASLKSLVPAVRVSGRVNQSTAGLDRIDRVTFDESRAALVDDVEGTVNELEVEGVWDLPALVFNSEVLDVTSMVAFQQTTLQDVTRKYFMRRRLQVDLILNPPADAATRLSQEMRVEELTAELDVLTGGLFTRKARRR